MFIFKELLVGFAGVVCRKGVFVLNGEVVGIEAALFCYMFHNQYEPNEYD